VISARLDGLEMTGDGLVILAPLRVESFAARRGRSGAAVERIGMGPARATAARARLERVLPPGRPVALVGLAGGLSPGMRPGDVVVASALGSTTGATTVQLRGGDAVAAILERAGLRVLHAPVVSSPVIVSGAKARAEAAAGGFVAVDMESYWCEPLARTRPFVVVRIALDVTGRALGSWSTVAGVPRAYRSLVRVARALGDWPTQGIDGTTLLEVGDL
jgi:4-hydroxy-3-methylbut-2-enyl diphosphate reductase